MNENEELMEEIEGESGSNEEQLPEVDDGENVAEGDVSDDSPQEETESIDTVSDGDSAAVLDEILSELKLNNEKIEELQTYQEERDMSIFEKPLSKYTAEEGILLLMFLFLVGYGIMKMVGGIIKCEVQ